MSSLLALPYRAMKKAQVVWTLNFRSLLLSCQASPSTPRSITDRSHSRHLPLRSISFGFSIKVGRWLGLGDSRAATFVLLCALAACGRRDGRVATGSSPWSARVNPKDIASTDGCCSDYQFLLPLSFSDPLRALCSSIEASHPTDTPPCAGAIRGPCTSTRSLIVRLSSSGQWHSFVIVEVSGHGTNGPWGESLILFRYWSI